MASIGSMFVQTMEICWQQLVARRVSRYLIKENQRSSKPLRLFTPVRFSDLFKKSLTFKDSIVCVRWSPNCNMLASASWDKTAKLVDISTAKVLYTGKNSDGGNLWFFYMEQLHENIRTCPLSMLSLNREEVEKDWRERGLAKNAITELKYEKYEEIIFNVILRDPC